MKQRSSFVIEILAILLLALCTTLANAQSGSTSDSGSHANAGAQDNMSSQSHMSAGDSAGRIVTVFSSQSFDKTYNALKKAIESKELKVIAEIDHAKNAESAEMKLPPTKVILFGNPKMGTPLMQAKQSMALDLPQRMAVYEDSEGKVHIIYNDPQMVSKEHELIGQDETIKKVSSALKMLANAGAGGGSKKQ